MADVARVSPCSVFLGGAVSRALRKLTPAVGQDGKENVPWPCVVSCILLTSRGFPQSSRK